MNISSDYSVTGNNYEVVRKVSSTDSTPFSIPTDDPPPIERSFQSTTCSNTQNDYRTDNAYAQIDSQRENNFLQEYIKKDKEDDEEEEDGRLVDYLLKALKGEEEELRAEGNSYMSDEDKMKLYGNHCPDLFPEFYALSHPSSGNLSL